MKLWTELYSSCDCVNGWYNLLIGICICHAEFIGKRFVWIYMYSIYKPEIILLNTSSFFVNNDNYKVPIN